LEKAYVFKKKVTENYDKEQKKLAPVPVKINKKLQSLKTEDLSVITV